MQMQLKSTATHFVGNQKTKGYIFGTITQNIRKEIIQYAISLSYVITTEQL